MYISGTDPSTPQEVDAALTDLQNQITANLAGAIAAINGLQAQIKQVTLTLEGELKTTLGAFAKLQAFVQSNITS